MPLRAATHQLLENLEQQWWKIDDNLTLDGTKASAYATILDSIRDGVTTIFDHHASFCEIPGSLFTIKDAAQELGMRSCLCYEVSDRRGQENATVPLPRTPSLPSGPPRSVAITTTT